jgi:cytochrome bd-type quinol oxidase subunit 2
MFYIYEFVIPSISILSSIISMVIIVVVVVVVYYCYCYYDFSSKLGSDMFAKPR